MRKNMSGCVRYKVQFLQAKDFHYCGFILHVWKTWQSFFKVNVRATTSTKLKERLIDEGKALMRERNIHNGL